MPPASRASAGTAQSDPTLAAERAHLASSRQFLRLMREDVLSLRALAGDPVSEEYLKADLYRRAEALKDLPDTPLFFGRVNYAAGGTGPGPGSPEAPDGLAGPAGSGGPGGPRGGGGPGGADRAGGPSTFAGEQFHIGRRHVHEAAGRPVVVDWRAPVSRPFYRASQAQPMGLELRRRFGFAGADLTAYEDEPFAAV